ncbi:protein PLASTID MOVEMENT IMPAIRED 2-like [Triticum dicoccoides]|uniref:protein PLASTID MOVEMENT IMPAIRED 2-like n=1 Tax=Triticum dicoccoides TaxID=85692 RepID=UPI00188F550D|nr:protein PLASTID MOVEMENT IMPAIRED 2-like [Triticum dicoccoides]
MEGARIRTARGYGGNESVSVGDGMSIFGQSQSQSIDVRRRGKPRRRATLPKVVKNVSYDVKQVARSGSGTDRLPHRRPPATPEREKEKARVGPELFAGKTLEQLVEQADAKAAGSHGPDKERARPVAAAELEPPAVVAKKQLERQGSRTSELLKGPRANVVVEAPGGGARPLESSGGTTYSEVMRELDRVKRELRELQREVKAAREAKGGMAVAEEDASSTATRSPGSIVAHGAKERPDADHEAKEVRVAFELTGAGRSSTRETEEEVTRWTPPTMGLQRGAIMGRQSVSSELEAWLTAASSDDRRLRHGFGHSSDSEITDEGHDSSPSLQAAEAKLDMARAELESAKGESLQFTASMERTRTEAARLAEEIGRLEEQEKKAGAQVRQLEAALRDAKCRLGAVTAADEMAGEILADLEATLRQLEEETEAAEKEKALMEQEGQVVQDDADSVDAEIAAAEQRIRGSIRELEAARASEAAATERLRAAVESAAMERASMAPRRSGNVTLPRFEYEYLTGRAEVVRAVADKKVAAAEAWVEARRAGEKEMIMRAEAIEKELGLELQAVDDESAAGQQRPRDGLQRAHTSRRAAMVKGSSAATSRRRTPSPPPSPLARHPRGQTLAIRSYLKLVGGKCTRP